MKSSQWMSHQRIVATVVIVAATALVSGCTTTPDSSTADANSPVMTDQMMSDMSMERTVLRALFDEPSLSGENILVSCVNGDVTLFGTVDSVTKSNMAESAVRNLSGVNNLRNSIVVN